MHNSTDYAGINLDSCTEVKFLNTNFKGNHAFTDADVSNADSTNTIGKGIAVRSTTANTTSNITFQNCKIEKFSRLVDVSYDSDTFVFTNCIFSDARFGLMAGEVTDGSTAGLTVGPKNIQILNSNFNKIFSSAIKVAAVDSINNVISSNNYFENTVGKNAGGNSSINVDPVIDFGTDQCSTDNDFFESNLTRPTTLPAQPLLDGVGSLQSSIRKITLSDNQSNIDTGIMFQALNSKKIEIDYKISRGSNVRIGTFTINPVYVNDSTTSVVHNDDYMEDDDIGLTLTPIYEDNDSTAGSESLTLQYTSTSTGEDLTMEYQIKSLV